MSETDVIPSCSVCDTILSQMDEEKKILLQLWDNSETGFYCSFCIFDTFMEVTNSLDYQDNISNDWSHVAGMDTREVTVRKRSVLWIFSSYAYNSEINNFVLLEEYGQPRSCICHDDAHDHSKDYMDLILMHLQTPDLRNLHYHFSRSGMQPKYFQEAVQFIETEIKRRRGKYYLDGK